MGTEATGQAEFPLDRQPASAVPDPERIVSIDVLRGFALLGILVMNIQFFAMVGAAYSNPYAYGDLSGANYKVWLLGHLFADQKFMAIFSMLFGAGICLMSERQEVGGRRGARIHYRRMTALLIFGLLHGYMLWAGDILYTYAICGMMIYPLRRLRPVALLIVALLCLSIPSGVFLFLEWTYPKWDQETQRGLIQDWQPDAEAVAKELAQHKSGWIEEFKARAPVTFGMQTLAFVFFLMWRAAGMMLVGMALFKLGVFSARCAKWTYLSMLIGGLAIGIPLILFGVHVNEKANWQAPFAKFIGGLFNYWGSIPVSLSWVSFWMLIFQSSLRPFVRPLAAVGQMAFTNYLMQSIICTMIFEGHGLGYFGEVDRVGQIETVMAIWACQLLVSSLWLHFFCFGPAEWLWRSLTYFRIPPMLRR